MGRKFGILMAVFFAVTVFITSCSKDEEAVQQSTTETSNVKGTMSLKSSSSPVVAIYKSNLISPYVHVKQPDRSTVGFWCCGHTAYLVSRRAIRSNYSFDNSQINTKVLNMHNWLGWTYNRVGFEEYRINGYKPTVLMLSQCASSDGLNSTYFSKEDRYLNASSAVRAQFKSYIESALQNGKIIVIPCEAGFQVGVMGHYLIVVEMHKRADGTALIGYKDVLSADGTTQYVEYTELLNSAWRNNKYTGSSASGPYQTSTYAAYSIY